VEDSAQRALRHRHATARTTGSPRLHGVDTDDQELRGVLAARRGEGASRSAQRRECSQHDAGHEVDQVPDEGGRASVLQPCEQQAEDLRSSGSELRTMSTRSRTAHVRPEWSPEQPRWGADAWSEREMASAAFSKHTLAATQRRPSAARAIVAPASAVGDPQHRGEASAASHRLLHRQQLLEDTQHSRQLLNHDLWGAGSEVRQPANGCQSGDSALTAGPRCIMPMMMRTRAGALPTFSHTAGITTSESTPWYVCGHAVLSGTMVRETRPAGHTQRERGRGRAPRGGSGAPPAAVT
jgi:hypothetical protein